MSNPTDAPKPAPQLDQATIESTAQYLLDALAKIDSATQLLTAMVAAGLSTHDEIDPDGPFQKLIQEQNHHRRHIASVAEYLDFLGARQAVEDVIAKLRPMAEPPTIAAG